MNSPIQKLICVTNRKLCRGDLFNRVEEIVKYKPKAILIREKDLTEEEYEEIAKNILKICAKENVPCILHNFIDTALKLKVNSIIIKGYLVADVKFTMKMEILQK